MVMSLHDRYFQIPTQSCIVIHSCASVHDLIYALTKVLDGGLDDAADI